MCSTGLSRYRLDTRALSVAEDFSLHTGNVGRVLPLCCVVQHAMAAVLRMNLGAVMLHIYPEHSIQDRLTVFSVLLWCE